MNIKNVKASIAILRRAKKFDMEFWQKGNSLCEDEESLHSCGMAACFGGYVAISPEFKASGGSFCPFGTPIIRDGRGIENYGSASIAYWLDITNGDSADLCCIGGEYTDFYAKDVCDVTKEDVIEKLELMLKGEESEA